MSLKGTLTGILNMLEKHSLTERKAHPTDGRRKLVRLSGKEHRLMRKPPPRINEFQRELVAELEKSEPSDLSRLLRIVPYPSEKPT